MKKLSLIIILSFACVGTFVFAQVQQQQTAKPEDVVQSWLTQWTKLDGTDASAARFAELYLPDGVHETGPSSRQIGIVRYEGQSDIRTMAKNFGAANGEITFRIATVTANEKDNDIVHLGQGSWGGPAAAIEYIAAYTVKESRKRYMSTGAAFFQIQNGKIRRVRMYTPREEVMEISP